MPLAHAPHSLTFREAANAVGADLVVDGVGYGPSRHARGQATPLSATAAYQDYGVEVARPWLVIVAPEDAALLSGPGCLCEHEGRLLVQSSPRETFEAHPVASHASAVFDELQRRGRGHG